jgi:hypothetical protein
LRAAFVGQARLLAERAERGLPIGLQSVRNLLRVFVGLAAEELRSLAAEELRSLVA